MPRKFTGKYLPKDHPMYYRLKLRLERRARSVFGLSITYMPPMPEVDVPRYIVNSQTDDASSISKQPLPEVDFPRYTAKAQEAESRGIENVFNKRNHNREDLDRIDQYESDDENGQTKHHETIAYNPDSRNKTYLQDDVLFMQDETMRDVRYTQDNITDSHESITYALDNVTEIPENVTYTHNYTTNLKNNVTHIQNYSKEDCINKKMSHTLDGEINKGTYRNRVTTMFTEDRRQETINIGNVTFTKDMNLGHTESERYKQGNRNQVHIMYTGNNESYEEDTANLQNISDVQDNVSEMQDNVSEMQGNVYEMQKNVSEIQENVPEIQDNVSEIQENVSEIHDNVSEMQNNVSEIQDNVSEIQNNASPSQHNKTVGSDKTGNTNQGNGSEKDNNNPDQYLKIMVQVQSNSMRRWHFKLWDEFEQRD